VSVLHLSDRLKLTTPGHNPSFAGVAAEARDGGGPEAVGNIICDDRRES
jgi:hypothetical protein